MDLVQSRQWNQGPYFLQQKEEDWPVNPPVEGKPEDQELRKSAFCGNVSVSQSPQLPDPSQFSTWEDMSQAAHQSLHGAADGLAGEDLASKYKDAEMHLLRKAQAESFPDEIKALTSDKPVTASSRLSCLSPIYENATGLIRVGGRPRKAVDLEPEIIHSIVGLPPRNHKAPHKGI